MQDIFNKKGPVSEILQKRALFILVEVRGVEPLSEKHSI